MRFLSPLCHVLALICCFCFGIACSQSMWIPAATFVMLTISLELNALTSRRLNR